MKYEIKRSITHRQNTLNSKKICPIKNKMRKYSPYRRSKIKRENPPNH